VQRPRDRGNIVERCLDGLYALGTVRVRRLLSFHLYFQLRLLLQALKMSGFGKRFRVLSPKEWWYDVPMLMAVRGDLSVSVCALGLTMLALVVVEIWGEVSPLWEIWWRSQLGEWYGVPRSGGLAM
jgi:hypothetical protein